MDGYRLLRPIGAGGFGQVWLCQSEALGDFHALKLIPSNGLGYLEREFEALCRYRAAAGQIRSPCILPIEHVNRTAEGLFYVMPLSDGIGSADKTSTDWHPLTLAARIEAQRTVAVWFSLEEILAAITPILQALQLLSDAGFVHRDVKPDNILFVNGTPCLGDISLLGEDRCFLTRKGTPGYSAPSWFLESGGNPDMYGAAMTLYSLLTGNAPDKAGRVAFRWPPQGERSLSPAARKDWLRVHRIIARAVDERVGERFSSFSQFERALTDLNERREDLRGRWFSGGGGGYSPSLGKIAAAFFLTLGGAVLALRSPTIREMAQQRLEDLIFPDSHPLSRRSRDCNLKLGDFWSEVVSESSSLSSMENTFFAERLVKIASDLKYLPSYHREMASEKVKAIRKQLLEELRARDEKPGSRLPELKKAAEQLALECGGDVEKEARESILRLERDLREKNNRHREIVQIVISRLEKLLEQEQWRALEDILDLAKKLLPE